MDMSVLSFENQCGIAQGTVNKMTDRSRLRTLEKIRLRFPQLNMEWLKSGKGEMLNEPILPLEDVAITLNSGISKHDAMEIIRDYQRQIQELKQQIIEKDARIQQLTDKLLGL